MKILDIQQRAAELGKRTAEGSITPQDVASLHTDTLQYILQAEARLTGLGIRRVYASTEEMYNDLLPADTNNNPLKFGQLACVHPGGDAVTEIYVYQGLPGQWQLAGKMGQPADLSALEAGKLARQINAINRTLNGDRPVDGSTPTGENLLHQVDLNTDAIVEIESRWEEYDTANISLRYDATEGELLLYTGRRLNDANKTPESTAVYLPLASVNTSGLMPTEMFDVISKEQRHGILTTAKEVIPTDATRRFAGRNDLVYMSVLNTSEVTNMRAMFRECSNLITAPMIDTGRATIMTYMFHSCQKLLHVPPMNTRAVTDMGGMFANCRSLTQIPAMDTRAVTNVGQMFNDCDSLIGVPPMNLDLATNVSYMFNGCRNLLEVNLYLGSAVNAEAMFNGCVRLIDAGLLHMSNVTNAQYMFRNCTELREVRLCDVGCSIAFRDCSHLSRESIVHLFAHARRVTGQSITLHPDCRTRITDEDVAIATGKGWVVNFN